MKHIEEVANQLNCINRGLLSRAVHDARNAASSILLLDAVSFNLAKVLPNSTEAAQRCRADDLSDTTPCCADLPCWSPSRCSTIPTGQKNWPPP
jgi:hypothetical protein